MAETLMDVLDHAIAGATTVPDSVYGIARVMAYQDQVTGVVEAPIRWRKFVDDVAALIDLDRRRVGARLVVRVGSVPPDRRLEFERVVRRFAHPRVTYVTAGAELEPEGKERCYQTEHAGADAPRCLLSKNHPPPCEYDRDLPLPYYQDKRPPITKRRA
jgi:hypothetical protein